LLAGTPSESALIADAQTTYDAVRKTHEKVIVMGPSLVTGVATALATTRGVEKVVLGHTPYDSVASVAAERYPWAPVRLLIKLECTTDRTSHVPYMLGSAACFAFHLGAPVPGLAGTWISLPINAQVTVLTTAKPRFILWRHFSRRIYRRHRS
jgi:hypothetical protein